MRPRGRLGHEFLAHVERCSLLIHLVDVGGDDPLAAYTSVRGELAEYGGGLERLPELVVLSKADLVPDRDSSAAAEEWARRLGPESLGVLAVSSVSGAGIEDLRRAILAAAPAPATELEAGPEDDQPAFEADHMTYRPAGDQGFDVSGRPRDIRGPRTRDRALVVATTSTTRRPWPIWSSA